MNDAGLVLEGGAMRGLSADVKWIWCSVFMTCSSKKPEDALHFNQYNRLKKERADSAREYARPILSF